MHFGRNNPENVYTMKLEGNETHQIEKTELERDLGILLRCLGLFSHFRLLEIKMILKGPLKVRYLAFVLASLASVFGSLVTWHKIVWSRSFEILIFIEYPPIDH